jgi:Zn-dependent protease with chaperone function
MDFFAHQDRARRQTRRMLLLFALAVAAIVVAADVVLFFTFGIGAPRRADGGLDWGPLAGVSAVVLLVIGLGSLYRIAGLRGGGAVVARQLGGVAVAPDTRDFAYRRLRNVVEEIAIASGVPVPDIFVLEEEGGINAFASGYAPTDAAITVTRGALEKLTRAELQGVIGHEFSHVLNGDMRLNIRLMGIVFGILVVATIGRRIAGSRGGSVTLGLALLAVGYVGVVFARLIKASISRQREFLADASAVQFTRQTEGIAGALKKIGGLAEGSKLASAETEEVAHMLFGDGVGYSALFATHPPLAARILRLDPAFRAEELEKVAAAWTRPVRLGEDAAERADVSIAGFAPADAFAPSTDSAALPPRDAEMRLSPAGVARQVGNPGNDDRAAAHRLRETIPTRLRTAAWRPDEAMPLIFALLLNDETDVRARQLALVAAHCGEPARVAAEALAEERSDLHPMHRLPLAALAFPILRRRPRPQLKSFMAALRALIDADGRVTLDEYCLAKLVGVQVIDALDPAAAQTMGRVHLPDAAKELRDLLAILARYGHEDGQAARRAYLLGVQEVLPSAAAAYAPPRDWVAALDRALATLDRLAPAGKELVVRALVRAIGADGKVDVAEAELLRTVCASLHCPLPPMLQESAAD